MADRVEKTDAEWLEQLGEDAFQVCRRAGTEPAFTGAYWDTKAEGVYRCRGCGHELFRSDAKYDSGTGWPSFSEPIDDGRVRTETDDSLGMRRVEVMCAKCDSHLGHVFPDGPAPTGSRYCMNSLSLDLDERENPSKPD